eukprot:1030366-Amphidinium_carterae.2
MTSKRAASNKLHLHVMETHPVHSIFKDRNPQAIPLRRAQDTGYPYAGHACWDDDGTFVSEAAIAPISSCVDRGCASCSTTMFAFCILGEGPSKSMMSEKDIDLSGLLQVTLSERSSLASTLTALLEADA